MRINKTWAGSWKGPSATGLRSIHISRISDNLIEKNRVFALTAKVSAPICSNPVATHAKRCSNLKRILSVKVNSPNGANNPGNTEQSIKTHRHVEWLYIYTHIEKKAIYVFTCDRADGKSYCKHKAELKNSHRHKSVIIWIWKIHFSRSIQVTKQQKHTRLSL